MIPKQVIGLVLRERYKYILKKNIRLAVAEQRLSCNEVWMGKSMNDVELLNTWGLYREASTA